MLIWLIGFHCPFKKKPGQKERVEKPQILNIGTGLCEYYLRDFTFDVVLGGWVG